MLIDTPYRPLRSSRTPNKAQLLQPGRSCVFRFNISLLRYADLSHTWNIIQMLAAYGPDCRNSQGSQMEQPCDPVLKKIRRRSQAPMYRWRHRAPKSFIAAQSRTSRGCSMVSIPGGTPAITYTGNKRRTTQGNQINPAEVNQFRSGCCLPDNGVCYSNDVGFRPLAEATEGESSTICPSNTN